MQPIEEKLLDRHVSTEEWYSITHIVVTIQLISELETAFDPIRPK